MFIFHTNHKCFCPSRYIQSSSIIQADDSYHPCMYRVLKDKYQVESNTGSFEFLLQFNVSWMTVNIFLDNTTIRDQIMIVFFFAN